jgi:hypothetical protein
MRAVAWLSLLSASTLFVACGGYTNLGNGPEAGNGGEDDGSGGSSMQSGGQAGKGSTGKGGSSMGTAGTQSMGTGGTASMGTGGMGGMGTPMTACAGRPCGSTCALTPGLDPATGMAAGADGEGEADVAAVVGYCAVDGSCGSAFPVCPGTMCSTNMDCPPLPALCGQCADGTLSCPTNVCIDGMCVIDAPSCTNECETSMDCAAAVAPCQICPDGTSSCPTVECVMGQCVGSVPGCNGSDPCTNRACGDVCTPCSPGGASCAPAQVLSFCNAAGVCQTGTPSCGSGNMCMTALDCPQTELCYMCSDGSCGTIDCLDGRCGYVCPEDPVGSCMTTADCGTPPPICEPCEDGSCAQMACVENSCEMVCNGAKMCSDDDMCPSCGQCGNLTVCVPYKCVEGLCTLECPTPQD